jgi:hypothetical protein
MVLDGGVVLRAMIGPCQVRLPCHFKEGKGEAMQSGGDSALRLQAREPETTNTIAILRSTKSTLPLAFYAIPRLEELAQSFAWNFPCVWK